MTAATGGAGVRAVVEVLARALTDRPDEVRVEVPVEYHLLATILERLLEKTGGTHAKTTRKNFDDASWVGFRLAELLPLENRERQMMLQTTDPLERLAQLMHTLPRFQSG